MIELLCATVSIIVFLYIGVPAMYERFARLRLKRKVAKSHAIVLTFDDGPGRSLTLEILHLLSKNNAKATFFLLGRNIAGREEIVRRIAEQEHEICSHGYDHLHHWKVSPIRAIKDIKRGWQVIDEVLRTHRGTYPFRPPFGRLNLVSLIYLLLLRVPIFYWTRDIGDANSSIKKTPRGSAIALNRTADVILAHDFDRCDNSVATFILESVKLTLEFAQNNQLRIMTASQLLSSFGPGYPWTHI